MYLKYTYKNKLVTIKESIINKLTIRINGNELLNELNWSYYTNLIPNIKFKTSLPIGYYTYSFSLDPLDTQYSGHLNFTNLDNVDFLINSNIKESFKVSTIIKEYNILRIMSGQGGLGWIN